MFQDVSGEKEELMFRLHCDYMSTAFGPTTASAQRATPVVEVRPSKVE
jgi:hypothetical protein